MKNLKIALIALLSATFLIACNKYEEGPIISLRKKEARVANLWEVKSAMSDGEDITDSFEKYELQLSEDGDATVDASYDFFGETFKSSSEGKWYFTDDEENITFNFDDDSFDGSYKIIELKENDMTLSQNGEDLELHFGTK